MGRLTTHVLDTVYGMSAKNINIELFKAYGQLKQSISSINTNDDDRFEKRIGENGQFTQGECELAFAADDYFCGQGLKLNEPAFLDQIAMRFMLPTPISIIICHSGFLLMAIQLIEVVNGQAL